MKKILSFILILFLCLFLAGRERISAETGPGSGHPGIDSGYGNNISDDLDNVEAIPETGSLDKSAETDMRKITHIPDPILISSAEKIGENFKIISDNMGISLKNPEEKSDITKEEILEKPETISKTAEPEKKLYSVKDGFNKEYYIKYRENKYSFPANPITVIDGEVYVCVTDPDFKNLFDDMGLTYSWYSYSNKLFVYLRRGSVNWEVSQDFAMVGDKKVNVPLKYRPNFSGSYIPVKTLTTLLDLDLIPGENYCEFRPCVQIAAENAKEENTINIVVSAATKIPYTVKYQANPPAIRLTFPRAGYSSLTDKFYVEGVQVRVNKEVDRENLFVTMQFPPHWKGVVKSGTYDNEVFVTMKPNLVYAWGIEEQMVESIDVTKTKDLFYLLFNTSGIVQYYWSYDPEENRLYVDIPFTTPSDGICLRDHSTEYVESCSVFAYKPDNMNITRIRLDLKPGTQFMIGPPQEQKGHSFALLLGESDKIPSPSPLQGSSKIIIAGREDSPLIVIDPGHGGSDPGACYQGWKEKDLVLDISKRLAKILSERGFRIILTRYTDTDVTYPGSPDREELQARSEIANKNNASLFVSIHCNASTKKEIRGSSYHWYKPIDEPVAKALKGSLGPNIGTVDKGLRKDKFVVLSHSKVPSVLVEAAFMSNPHDMKILANANHRHKIAHQLALSIDYFINSSNLANKGKGIPDLAIEEKTSFDKANLVPEPAGE